MSLNESIVEDSSLNWFWELGYGVGHGRQFARCEPVASRDAFGRVVLAVHFRQAPLQRNLFPVSFRRLVIPNGQLPPMLLRGELSAAVAIETIYA